MNVAVLGASNKPDRYSYRAVMLLKAKGHTVFPIHPSLKTLEDIPVHSSLKTIQTAVDTITIYLSPANQQPIEEEIIQNSAGRIIFNPGAENPALAERLVKTGKKALNACTLVMLSTGQF